MSTTVADPTKLRMLIPLCHFADLSKYRDRVPSSALLVYASLPPATAIAVQNGHVTRFDDKSDVYWNIEDPDLASYVNDRRITLEICLTSNVQTRVVPAYDAHPLRTYFDHGMSVTLSTDNRLVSGTTLTDEYLHAARALDFTLHELGEIALESFASAFLPWETRRTLLDEARREIEALTTAR